MMAADYRHIGGRENRLGRHYSRFSPFWPTPALSGQSLDLRKLCDAGSNRRSQANASRMVGATCAFSTGLYTVAGDIDGLENSIITFRSSCAKPPCSASFFLLPE